VVEDLLNKEYLGIRAEVFVALSECFEHCVASLDVFYDSDIRGRDVFENEALEGAVVLLPYPR
jgi:hypothetical protein